MQYKGQYNDSKWRLNNLYYIIDKAGNRVKFAENGAQSVLNKVKSKRKYILKARQLGFTTNEVLKLLDFVMFHRNKTVCILAHEKKALETIFKIPTIAHRYMDPRVQPKLGKGGGSKYELYFPENESRIYTSLEVRGGTTHRLHISEAAFAESSRIKASTESVPIDGMVTYETTPNGMGNHFYKSWIDPSQRYDKCFFPWFFHSEYWLNPPSKMKLTPEEKEFCIKTRIHFKIDITRGQIAFRRAKQEDLKELYIQEYPEDDKSCFLASGNAAMDLMQVSKLLEQLSEPIEDEGYFKVWKSYNKNHEYVIGADCAEGVRKDYSVASVFDVNEKEQVAQIRSNTWRPFEFAKRIEHLANRYWAGGKRHPLVAVELNNHGHAVNGHLDETLEYPNMYKYKDDTVGWRTDMVTRPLMVDTFIDGVEHEHFKINSRETLNECLTLIDNKGKIEANEGEHDDCIISDAIAIQMVLNEAVGTLYDNMHQKIRM